MYANNSAHEEVRGPALGALGTAIEQGALLGDLASAARTGERLDALNSALENTVRLLSSPAGTHLLAADPAAAALLGERVETVHSRLRIANASLDAGEADWDADEVEQVQILLRRALDLAWTLAEDRIAAAARVRELAGLGAAAGAAELSPAASVSYFALEMALDSLDRLEVRGRDSAGVHLWVRLSETDLADLAPMVAQRHDALFRSGAVEQVAGCLSIVYKTASLVGRLGDNVRALRASIRDDALLREILRRPSARVSVLGHTRWASVGRVSQPNAHPLNNLAYSSTLADAHTTRAAGSARYAVGALNGDIDNHVELRTGEGIEADPEVTTDAKLIPVMVAQRLDDGADAAGALHDCLRRYRGSMAIGVQTDDAPDRLLLGVKGGGQGLYVGLGPAGYLVASEVFGLVAWSTRYLRIDVDGDAPGEAVVVCVDGADAGTAAGLRRIDGTGAAHQIPEAQFRLPEVATRDIARGGFERYLEKELAEAPASFRRTLRGRVHERDGRLTVDLPDSALPTSVRERLRDGSLDEVIFIGQGTAAVAASGIAYLAESLFGDRIRVRTMPATELSAWHLHRDLSHACIVAISQSGTTTDTNRTVDLVRERGATVLAIVNRRDSDLVAKSDGVLYTSDGRDIEMAVASTKAFYAQAAAGMLLSLGFAKQAGILDPHDEDALLRTLAEIPDKLEELEKSKAGIAAIAEQVACRYRYSAVLGSGPNRIAAAEVRIKLSELCYCGVSSDAVEDKKHIDLSAESLVLVCAAGTPVTQLHDVVKEVEIFAAHRNRPVMIVDAGTGGLWPTELIIEVPPTHPKLAWILSTAAGHLFAYYAARAIDQAGDDLRLALTALDQGEPGGTVAAALALGRFVDDCGRGLLRGVLGSDTGMRLAAAHWFLTGALPASALPEYTEGADPLEFVRQILDAAVDEMTRSIDSVKHQAKTVTVGTSRSGAYLFDSRLAKAVLETGVDRDTLGYATLAALRGYDAVVTAVAGATRYALSGSPNDLRIKVVSKSGIAQDLPSRADAGTELMGTKKLAVETGSVRLERGINDGRLVLIVPETSGSRPVGVTLLHVELAPRASGTALLAALEASGPRLLELRAAITERDRPFTTEALSALDPELVLLAPAARVAAAMG
ncbi:SIS domain-containing protein [Actinocrinis puniceicyclus]|uniref:SIS domain-containing protein n=1 Tax=Actinocrinis puniceicyclus TaxID=977794 RepID=UPI001B8CA6E1|nr:SIS domain-containing protein [Actinocrinis puniceicyclus]